MSLFSVGVFLVVNAITTPWGFYLGGRFHAIPGWQGWGRVRARSGGEYVLYVSLTPTVGSIHVSHRSWINGVGYACTPRGEQWRLTLIGSMRPASARRSTAKRSASTCTTGPSSVSSGASIVAPPSRCAASGGIRIS